MMGRQMVAFTISPLLKVGIMSESRPFLKFHADPLKNHRR